MQLLRLEIKGFKSFGDKVVVRFDEGITGVVGPNGCGKSNIIDAMRWVLGEHRTRHLRSDKMSNIIFNGTAKRKAADAAEVSLFFENTKQLLPAEYKEVCITRRYTRSGSSEYFLNGTACRRKDITNLLMNTGATSNSYAIIELKMVDDILTDRENARKVMFEEAAGVAQFKQRKKETLAKLEATLSDLERVEDLMHEIEKNMKGLERQAKQAEKYFSTKEAYEKFSVALAKRQVKSNSDDFVELNSQINEILQQKETLTQEQENLEKSIEDQKNTATEQEKVISEKKRYLSSQIDKINHLQNEKVRNEDRTQFLSRNRQQIEEQLLEDESGTKQAGQSLESLQQNLASQEKQFLETQTVLEDFKKSHAEEKVKTENLRAAMQAAQEKFKMLQNDILILQKEVELKENQQSGSKQESEQMALDFSGQADQLQSTLKKVAEIENDLKARNNEISELENSEAERTQKISSLTSQIESLKEQIGTKQREESSLKAEYNLTKSLVENMEGFSSALKFLGKDTTSWSENAVLLADIFTAKDDYDEALLAVLEPYLNFYVVQTEAEARNAMTLLSENEKGKANFFILEKLENIIPSLPPIDGAVAALAVIEFDEKYKKLAYSLFHNVYFSENDNSNDVEGFTIALKNGEFVARNGGNWTGGKGKENANQNSQLGRKQRLEELGKSLQNLEIEISELENQRNEFLVQIENLQEQSKFEELRTLKNETNHVSQQKISLQARAEQMQENVRRSEERKEAAQERLSILAEQIEKLKPQISQKKEQVTQAERAYYDLNENYSIQNERFSEISEELQESTMSFIQFENKLENLKQEIKFKETSLLTGKERITQSQQQLQEIAEEVSQLKEKIASQIEEITSLEEIKGDLQADLGEIESQFYRLREEITRVEKVIKELQRQRENCDTRTMSFQNKLNETKLKLTATRERLSAEFEIELTDELLETQTEEDEFSDETLIDEIEAAKRRLQRIGTINATAKEAYDEIKERHDFITEQRSDLFDAQKLLEDTIAELDEAAKTAFLDAFNQIRKNFIRVFRSLFSEEDNCDLVLSNPEDPLESKIEIIAQPKGKRPLTIKQLSGGEKTLTAVALLFALYLLRPAPFCIFDEVDAPLDDANIDKFNRIIKKFAEEVQFIIVTHNKRTMVSTDVVYGVTMPEIGVSKVLPVDLKGILVD
ncbi:chromosome segregation protein SMC [Bernardetia sp.]|uniref:chromosome segregation protein SMC n=1 Tax=Bernardetia sp. TaxID=1937974 RepID=UPI0025C6D4AF|nr:chromosome segregation protein SMC [Bernardetia sp.]